MSLFPHSLKFHNGSWFVLLTFTIASCFIVIVSSIIIMFVCVLAYILSKNPLTSMLMRHRPISDRKQILKEILSPSLLSVLSHLLFCSHLFSWVLPVLSLSLSSSRIVTDLHCFSGSYQLVNLISLYIDSTSSIRHRAQIFMSILSLSVIVLTLPFAYVFFLSSLSFSV